MVKRTNVKERHRVFLFCLFFDRSFRKLLISGPSKLGVPGGGGEGGGHAPPPTFLLSNVKKPVNSVNSSDVNDVNTKEGS